jgi:hypothetical protein
MSTRSPLSACRSVAQNLFLARRLLAISTVLSVALEPQVEAKRMMIFHFIFLRFQLYQAGT